MMPRFESHVAQLQDTLAHRAASVARIEHLLNCQKKPEYWQDFALLTREFNACFGNGAGATYALRDELEQAHWAAGFKPRAQAGNELVDPVEQMLRAFFLWRATRWPGQNGRVHFAHTLFNLHVVRLLALLAMRLWDEPGADVPARLARLQALLDALWTSAPADQPVLVRDVRWLFPVAMSPTTDSLAPYFTVAERIATTFTPADRLETQKAWVVTGAGHLRSQLRDLAQRRNVPLDAPDLVLLTRVSNALDVALLTEGLVTLLEAYAQALQDGAERTRLELAAAICQGFSPDPELFVNRIDLLAPYTMLEHLFITSDAQGHASYTPAGSRHRDLLARYATLVAQLAAPLHADCAHSAPRAGAWSPYGALYGFASNLLELIAFRTLARDAVPAFGMEDVFTPGDAARRAWVEGWRKLPHIKPEIVQQFAYPEQFAEAIHARIADALQRRVAGKAAPASGRIVLLVEEEAQGAEAEGAEAEGAATQVPQLPPHYRVSSDPQLVATGTASAKDEADLLHCRNEGEFLVSYATDGGWTALTKDLLTAELGAGRDVAISAPRAAAAVLRLMCPGLVIESTR